jgi:hypothetical protein
MERIIKNRTNYFLPSKTVTLHIDVQSSNYIDGLKNITPTSFYGTYLYTDCCRVPMVLSITVKSILFYDWFMEVIPQSYILTIIEILIENIYYS